MLSFTKSLLTPVLTLSFIASGGLAFVSAATLPDGCTSTIGFSITTGMICDGSTQGQLPINDAMAPVDNGNNSDSCLILSNNLSYGKNDATTNGEVTKLQTFLKTHTNPATGIPYLVGNTSGSFGTLTRFAVKQFQVVRLTGVVASDIDSTIITSATDRSNLATTGFRLTNSGNVATYTRAKIAYVSCHEGNSTVVDPVITTTTLPNGTVGTAYIGNIVSTGGTGTRDWNITAGVLPPGLYLNKVFFIQGMNGGTGSQPAVMPIFGTPTTAGNYTFTATVTTGSQSASKQFTLVIVSSTNQTAITATSSTDLSGITGSIGVDSSMGGFCKVQAGQSSCAEPLLLHLVAIPSGTIVDIKKVGTSLNSLYNTIVGSGVTELNKQITITLPLGATTLYPEFRDGQGHVGSATQMALTVSVVCDTGLTPNSAGVCTSSGVTQTQCPSGTTGTYPNCTSTTPVSPAPVITSVSPTAVSYGGTVVITGSGFDKDSYVSMANIDPRNPGWTTIYPTAYTSTTLTITIPTVASFGGNFNFQGSVPYQVVTASGKRSSLPAPYLFVSASPVSVNADGSIKILTATAMLNQPNQQANRSTTLTISGTANVTSVYVSATSNFGPVYTIAGTGAIPVINGVWSGSLGIDPSSPNGTYPLNVYDSSTKALLTSGTLTISNVITTPSTIPVTSPTAAYLFSSTGAAIANNSTLPATESIKINTTNLFSPVAASYKIYLTQNTNGSIYSVEKIPGINFTENTLIPFGTASGFLPGNSYTIEAKGCNSAGVCGTYGNSVTFTISQVVTGTIATMGSYTYTFGTGGNGTVTGITKTDALANCQQTISLNPYTSVSCSWNGTVILTAAGSPRPVSLPVTSPTASYLFSSTGAAIANNSTLPATESIKINTTNLFSPVGASYKLEITDGNNTPVIKTPGVDFTENTSTAFNIGTGFLPGHTYQIRVQGCSSSGTCGAFSNAVTFTIAPQFYIDGKLTSISSSLDVSHTYSWSLVPGATSYLFTINQSTNSILVTNSGLTTTSSSVSFSGTPRSVLGITSITGTYNLSVQACNLSGCGASSNIVTLTPLVASVQNAGTVLGDFTMCINLPTNLHRGAESEEVRNLQSFLVQKGLLSDTPTGFYGDKTVEAVKDYQASKGLPATGMVYDFTRSTIMSESCK